MIVWGGLGPPDALLADGARYAPAADRWFPLPSADAPSPRLGHTAVWANDELIVWAGYGYPSYPVGGGRYSRRSDRWLPLRAPADAP